MLDLNALVRKLDAHIRDGKSDEEAVVLLFQSGEGQLPIGRAYSSYRNLARVDALYQVRKWTNGIERLPQLARRSVFNRDIREIFDDASISDPDAK